ncbi:MAG TPA: helical backbone metal receptor [Thermoanaerobaculia bacterium]|nr:helical backbone metal receptor [Thermoanaerobaculia bacterium]
MPFTDILGRSFEFTAPPRRVVSLVPSLTETLFDLGAGDAVAGITDFCTFPENLDRPRLGGTKTPRIAAIRELQPDLVYVNLEENLQKHAEAIETFAPVFATEPQSVDHVRELIALLGNIHRREQRAAELVTGLDATRHSQPRRSFTFLCPIWKDPWMWCGGDTYVSNLVATTGGRNLLESHKRYPAIDLRTALALHPDIVFLPDEPYVFGSGHADELRAMTDARIIGPFPGHLFTWHGSRTILGVRFLREALD